jgi:3-phenylpropionate/cinnamic acid dioxygenase small subunit
MLYKDPLESPSSIFLLSHTILLLARKILYQYETEKNGLQDKIIKIKTSRKSTINAASKYNHKKSN